MALPKKGLADLVVARFTKKPPPPAAGAEEEPDGDEGPEPMAPSDDDGDEGAEAGANGKVIIAAQRRGDAEALEEAVKAIVRECLEEQGGAGK